jgi:hypothetical protein
LTNKSIRRRWTCICWIKKKFDVGGASLPQSFWQPYFLLPNLGYQVRKKAFQKEMIFLLQRALSHTFFFRIVGMGNPPYQHDWLVLLIPDPL